MYYTLQSLKENLPNVVIKVSNYFRQRIVSERFCFVLFFVFVFVFVFLFILVRELLGEPMILACYPAILGKFAGCIVFPVLKCFFFGGGGNGEVYLTRRYWNVCIGQLWTMFLFHYCQLRNETSLF